jgi:hypothetical protein
MRVRLLGEMGCQQYYILVPDLIASNYKEHVDPAMLNDILESTYDIIIRLRWRPDSLLQVRYAMRSRLANSESEVARKA